MKTLALPALALSLAANASAGTLYGIDYDATNPATTTVVTINESTAVATALFTFSTNVTNAVTFSPRGLAYNPNTGHLYSVGESVVGSTFSTGLYDIDLGAQTATFVSVAGNLNLEGIDYLAAAGSLVVSYDPASYYTTHLAKITTGGLVGSTYGLPTVDSDTLGIDPTTGDLLVYDASNPTGNDSLNRILNPLGSPSAAGLYSGPNDPINDRDLASDGGALFLTNGSSLVQFNPGLAARYTVGSFVLAGRKPTIVGIAAAPVPEPASLLVLSAGGAALLRRRRR